MTREPTSDTARRLAIGLSGDADQRTATMLLTEAAHGIWLDKLAGWPEYMRPLEGSGARMACTWTGINCARTSLQTTAHG